MKLFGSKKSPSLTARPVRGGRLHTLVLRGFDNPLAEGADLSMWDSAFLGFGSDGITSLVSGAKYRARQFLADTGPIHPAVDPRTGQRTVTQFVFGHMVVAIHRSFFRRDAYECNGEGAHGLAQGLEALMQEEYGDRLWEPNLGIRVAVVPHDLESDKVLVKVGRAVVLPGTDDEPTADVTVVRRDGEGVEKAVPLLPWRFYAGHPGHLDMIEKPVGIYGNSRYFLISECEELASVILPDTGSSDGLSGRFGIDLTRQMGLVETGSGLAPDEVSPEVREDKIIFTFDAPGRSPIPGGQPEALIVTVSPRAAVVETAEAIQSVEREPAEDVSPAVRVEDMPVATERVADGEQTIIVGPRPGVATSVVALDVVGVALHAIPSGGSVLNWKIQLDADGNVISEHCDGGNTLTIGSSSANLGLWTSLPGQRQWHRLSVPDNLTLAGGDSVSVFGVPPEIADHYLGILELPRVVTLTLPAGRHVFGRAGGSVDNKLAVGLLTQPGSLEAFDAPSSACLEFLGLSKDHLALRVEDKGVRVEMLGRASAWRLSGDLVVIEELLPGETRAMRLELDEHLLVGPYLLRAREI